MYKLVKALIYCCMSVLLCLSAYGENFKYSTLQVRDFDEMMNEVKARIYKAKQTSLKSQAQGVDEEGDRDAIEILRNTLKLILSRPDEDNMVSKLIPFVRSELNNFNAFEDTMTSVAEEAIRSIDNERLPVVYRGTALFILENLMSEIRPELENKEDFKILLGKIRDAKIKIPDKVRNERKLRSMYKSKSPSDIASAILKAEEEMEKKRAATKAKTEAKDKKAK